MTILLTFLFSVSLEETTIKASMYPYTIKDKIYYPSVPIVGESREVLASWYGEYFHGRKTASGEIYDMHAYSVAHKTFPLGTVLLVTNTKNNKSLKLRVNDRGPFWNNRELDLSMQAAHYLETKESGVAKVMMEVISVPDIVQGFKVRKKYRPITPDYNLGYSAISYMTIKEDTKEAIFEVKGFINKNEADIYHKKLLKSLPNAYVDQDKHEYKIKFHLSADRNTTIQQLNKLKKIGLITGYGLFWSYN
ncbi:MAG TPA: septal ring lytic transglycosylase RlpA family protein [Arcobacter sp.]|nr:septal ring lytic transglycosylase RlpA family protein [Arcobacter sp.]